MMKVELSKEQVKALKGARKDISDVDTDMYHGTGELETLQYKVQYIEKWIDTLMGVLGIDRCKECGEELQPSEPDPDFPQDGQTWWCTGCRTFVEND